MTFFAELKRRNVIRVGLAYAAIAWLVAQIADLALGVFGAPDLHYRGQDRTLGRTRRARYLQ